ncbi:hypothetical protein BCR35DRAFT_300814 [Leucosporidium creatinivorum]|uniref:Uncharacterized protein n=1 Tax=Leucosporidium creatinivorum TaxID=106004 RepID=A0A1Y2G067_9BASI|nr:hypothetical protein BCR35DRAFT_300814 [Leucosporidium creatinivorum]
MLLGWLLAFSLAASSSTAFASPVQLPFGSDSQARGGGDDSAESTRESWRDPRPGGGSMLDQATDWGLGEPLNIIISSKSSPDVLRESGFIAYSRSLGLWAECANLHLGDAQYANLGDGKGWEPELFEMRESWWPYVGSCLESVIGGNHFRAWKQNGSEADTGAWFLAASKEVDARGNHKIAHDGYNVGRDLIIQKALEGTRYLGRSWTTTVEWVEGLLPAGSDGINHDIAQDGRVAVLTAIEF